MLARGFFRDHVLRVVAMIDFGDLPARTARVERYNRWLLRLTKACMAFLVVFHVLDRL